MADISTPMTLENFESSLSETMLKRGRDYFEDGAVVELAPDDRNTWHANVSGSDEYEVVIKFAGKNIIDCYCTCPHDVLYCKHVIATLYAIREQGPNIKKENKKGTKKSLPEIVNDLTESELKQFILEYAKDNRDFRDLLQARYAAKTGTGGKAIYARLIQSAARRAEDGETYVDYYHASAFARDVNRLLDQARAALSSADLSVAIDIIFAVIENVHDVLTDADDSAGRIGECVREAFEMLTRLVRSDLPLTIRQRIFNDAMREAKKAKYDYFDFDDSWLEIVVAAIYDPTSETLTLELIESLLKDCNKIKDGWHKEYDQQKLIKHKLAILRKAEKGIEANQLRLEYLHLPEIRIDLITEKIAEKQYPEAKLLINEGVKIAEKQGNARTLDQYKQLLLQIAKEDQDSESFRAIAKDLYKTNGDMEHYRALKAAYDPADWPAIAEEIIKETPKKYEDFNGGLFKDGSRLADIFVEERYWERLLLLLQDNQDIHFIDTYASWLNSIYPQEMLQVYGKAISEFAWQGGSGRDHYIALCKRLKQLQTWDGGDLVVKKLVEQFRQEYSQKWAMMEELSKLKIS